MTSTPKEKIELKKLNVKLRREFIDEFANACKILDIYQGAVLSKSMQRIIDLSNLKTAKVDLPLPSTKDVNEIYKLRLANQRLEKELLKLKDEMEELKLELVIQGRNPMLELENKRLRNQNILLKNKCNEILKKYNDLKESIRK